MQSTAEFTKAMGKLGRTEKVLARTKAELAKAMIAYMDYHRAVQVLVFEPTSPEADKIRQAIIKSKENGDHPPDQVPADHD